MVMLFSAGEDDDNDEEDSEDDFGSDFHRESIYGDDDIVSIPGKIYPCTPVR